MALEDGFQSAKIEGRGSATGAEQYSFFGSFEDFDDGDLGGGLEDGVAAPPEEEKLERDSEVADLGDLDPELAGSGPDMSFATMFANSEDAVASSREGTPALSLGTLASSSTAADGLLDDPWGQLPGLSVSRRHEAYNAPQLTPMPHQQLPLEPSSSAGLEAPNAAGAYAGSMAMDARQGQALQGSGFLVVDQSSPDSLQHQQHPDQRSAGPPVAAAWGGEAHSQLMHQVASGQMPPPHAQMPQQPQRISTPMTVMEVEAQMRAQSLGTSPGASSTAEGPTGHPPPPTSSRQSLPMTLQQQQQVAVAAAAAQAAYHGRGPPQPPPGMQHSTPLPLAPYLGPHVARSGVPEGQFGGLPPGHPGLMARRPPPGWRPPPPSYPPPDSGMWPNGRPYGVPLPRPLPGSPPRPLVNRPPPLQGGRPPPHLLRRPPGPHAAGPHFMQPPQGMPPRGPHVFESRPNRPQMVANGRQHFESKCMSRNEIDTILRIQWRSLHNGPPYQEDYYFQAFINKHGGGRNARWFAPESIRQLAPSERCAAEATTFLSVDGLGRIPFSNVRRPRPLMDVASASAKQVGGSESDGGSKVESAGVRRRPLEQEPALAARIMIEDCLALLLDVQDIDRVFAASPRGVPEGEAALRRRRALLMDGLAASLRLQQPSYLSTVAPATVDEGSTDQQPAVKGKREGRQASYDGVDDGVLQQLLSLRKGRDLLARALALAVPPQGAHVDPAARRIAVQSPSLLFGLLRNLRAVFRQQPADGQGDSRRQSHMGDVAVGGRVAAAAVEVVRRLHSPAALAAALGGIVGGDLQPHHATPADSASPTEERMSADRLLPMYPPDEMAGRGRLWLADLLAAVLVRAAETEAPSAAHPLVLPWAPSWTSFATLLTDHLSNLKAAHSLAVAQGDSDAAKVAQDVVPVVLIRAALPHCTDAQRLTIHDTLTELTSQPQQQPQQHESETVIDQQLHHVDKTSRHKSQPKLLSSDS